MRSEKNCEVKDNLVNQLIALNNKVNTLSPGLLHSEQARAEVEEKREGLYLGNQGKKDMTASPA
jgi:hypothetical protein